MRASLAQKIISCSPVSLYRFKPEKQSSQSWNTVRNQHVLVNLNWTILRRDYIYKKHMITVLLWWWNTALPACSHWPPFHFDFRRPVLASWGAWNFQGEMQGPNFSPWSMVIGEPACDPLENLRCLEDQKWPQLKCFIWMHSLQISMKVNMGKNKAAGVDRTLLILSLEFHLKRWCSCFTKNIRTPHESCTMFTLATSNKSLTGCGYPHESWCKSKFETPIGKLKCWYLSGILIWSPSSLNLGHNFVHPNMGTHQIKLRNFQWDFSRLVAQSSYDCGHNQSNGPCGSCQRHQLGIRKCVSSFWGD